MDRDTQRWKDTRKHLSDWNGLFHQPQRHEISCLEKQSMTQWAVTDKALIANVFIIICHNPRQDWYMFSPYWCIRIEMYLRNTEMRICLWGYGLACPTAGLCWEAIPGIKCCHAGELSRERRMVSEFQQSDPFFPMCFSSAICAWMMWVPTWMCI